MARSKELAIHNRCVPHIMGGKIVPKIEQCEVRVMARAEGYVMVRRPGAVPFVVHEKELEAIGSIAAARNGEAG